MSDMSLEEREQELQEAVSSLELMSAQMEALAQERTLLSQAYEDYRAARESLQRLNEVAKKDGKGEMLVPVGGRMMLKASLIPGEKVLLGIGAGVFVEKTPEEALETAEERMGDLEKSISQVDTALSELKARAEALEKKAREQYISLQRDMENARTL